METLKAQLEAMQPNVALIFTNNVARMFETITRHRTNTFSVGRIIYNTDYPLFSAIRHMLDASPNSNGTTTFLLNCEKVKAEADRFAERSVCAWYDKICNKANELNDVMVQKADFHEFRIYGKRAGKAIRMEQTMIVNCSSKGVLFNQFPCRIYVDGKLTSEAKYKQM